MTPDHENSTAGRFDRAARASHAQSVQHLSPTVLAALRRARTGAAAPRRPRGMGWLAAGSAAALALVAALQLQPDANDERSPPGPRVASVAADAPAQAVADEEVATMLAALEENPDFYLWLAANDEALPPAEFSR